MSDDDYLTPDRERWIRSRVYTATSNVPPLLAALDIARFERATAIEESRALARDLAEVRDAARRFKMAILSALGRHDPWAVTVVSQQQMVDLIHALRRSEVRLQYVLDRLPLAIKYPWGDSYETCVLGIDAEMARSSLKEPNDDRTRHDPDPGPDAAPDTAPADDGG